MEILVRHYLHQDPDPELDILLEQYASALWMEDRYATILSGAVSRAFNGK